MGQLIIIALLVFAVCAICSAVSSEDDAKKAEEKKNVDTQAALRPKAFVALFAEEFPAFANQINYSKAENFISRWEKSLTSLKFHAHTNWNNTKFKDDKSAVAACNYIVNENCGVISDDFRAFALRDSVATYATLNRLLVSSVTLSKA